MQAKEKELTFRITDATSVTGNLSIPDRPSGLVIFSHGSGSSRFSTRNRAVARHLNQHGFATLLTDLLTEEEDSVYENRFNIELLTDRLVSVTKYATAQPGLDALPTGYFGASTGAASALRAAATLGAFIQAVVSRGGRPDLASLWLSDVTAPTLLIVGSLDTEVLSLNERALAQLHCKKELKLVKDATHLFEEPGKLEEVASLATDWFSKHLVPENEPTRVK
jgi:putative phosphoribosyl transferase